VHPYKVNVEIKDANLLYAQATPTGLIDSTPKVVMKLFQDFSGECFIAIKEHCSGIINFKRQSMVF
jgi:hypothetical protein